MAQVKAFAIGGVYMWIPSGDHEPPHFHARRAGEWAAKVYILEAREAMIELERPPDAIMRGSDRRALIRGVEQHRGELLAEWEACQGGERGR